MKISVFAVLAVLILALSVRVYFRTYVYEDFPIFTSEEEIEETRAQAFGVFADYP